MEFSYLVPVYNEEKLLRESVRKIQQVLSQFPGSEILLLENGSTDGSKAIVRELEDLTSALPTRSFILGEKGLGHAYRRGVQEAKAQVIVFGAADLPFETTDLENFVLN